MTRGRAIIGCIFHWGRIYDWRIHAQHIRESGFMKVIKVTALTLAMLLLAIVLLISYITLSHGGMQRLFSLGKSYVQGELHWGELQGTLVGPAEINDLDYSGDDGTSVQIDNIQFDWQPRRLIRRQLSVCLLYTSPSPRDS